MMQSHKGRILYIEDDADSRELIHFAFTRRGYQLVCAESGPEALQLATAERFDLFLVDNWMPDLTGVELTRHIRAFNQITPILFYSGAAHQQDRLIALNAGAQGYLTKPSDIDDLIAEAERLMKQSI